MASADSDEPRRESSPFVLRFDEHDIECELPEDTIRLGRDEANQLCVADESVSPFHAELIWDGRHLFVRDLDSENGTTVNGVQIREAELASGDCMHFGGLICSVTQLPPLAAGESVEEAWGISAGKLFPAEHTIRASSEKSPREPLDPIGAEDVSSALPENADSMQSISTRPEIQTPDPRAAQIEKHARRIVFFAATAVLALLLGIVFLIRHGRRADDDPYTTATQSPVIPEADVRRQQLFDAQVRFDLERDPVKQAALEAHLKDVLATAGNPPAPSRDQRQREEAILNHLENVRERLPRAASEVIWLTGIIHELRTQGYGLEHSISR